MNAVASAPVDEAEEVACLVPSHVTPSVRSTGSPLPLTRTEVPGVPWLGSRRIDGPPSAFVRRGAGLSAP